MQNPNSVCVLVDAADRIILLSGWSLPVTLFAKRNVLDVRFLTVSMERWHKTYAPQMGGGGLFSLRGSQFSAVDPSSVSDVVRQKMMRVRLLTEGYSHLLWLANQAVEPYWSSASIDYSDLPLLQVHRNDFVELYAKSKSLTLEEAQKQISFDEQNLATLALRRKQILWLYEESLLAVQNQQELAVWKTQVYNDTVNIGAV